MRNSLLEIVRDALKHAPRRISVERDVRTASFAFFDDEYQIPLGSLGESRLLAARSNREMADLIVDVCREPTSLEILTYAQLTGPHVHGGFA